MIRIKQIEVYRSRWGFILNPLGAKIDHFVIDVDPSYGEIIRDQLYAEYLFRAEGVEK